MSVRNRGRNGIMPSMVVKCLKIRKQFNYLWAAFVVTSEREVTPQQPLIAWGLQEKLGVFEPCSDFEKRFLLKVIAAVTAQKII